VKFLQVPDSVNESWELSLTVPDSSDPEHSLPSAALGDDILFELDLTRSTHPGGNVFGGMEMAPVTSLPLLMKTDTSVLENGSVN